jgi:Fur family transcriptional regulator, ferric uptake regulator
MAGPERTWQEELRARGYRLTPQRQLVLEAVTSLGHANAEEILCHVQRTAGGVNISTVYRTLELLESLALVRHAHLGHGVPTYHPATAAEHLHLVCRDCGAVSEADIDAAEPLARRLAETHGFQTDVQHFAVYGRCRDCAAAKVENRSAPSAAFPLS